MPRALFRHSRVLTARLLLLVACHFTSCLAARVDCDPADPFCNPLATHLLYARVDGSTSSTRNILPGETVALSESGATFDTYQITDGKGYVTRSGLFTASLSLDPTIVEATAPDGKREAILVRTSHAPGNGTFGSEIATNVCANPAGLEVADFNGDGWDDAAVACSAAGLAVLIGQGDGTFAVTADVSGGQTILGVQTGDFNGDGIFDLAGAVSPTTTPGLQIFIGDGQGGFTAGVTATTTAGNKSSARLTRGDFDRDGIHDLTLFAMTSAVDQYRGTGDTTTLNVLSLGAYSPISSISLSAAEDFNGDGYIDIVTSQSPDIAFHPNTNGSFSGSSIVGGPGTTVQGIVPGDFNQDGNMDFAFNYSNQLEIFTGNGDGTFQQITAITLSGSNPAGIDTADFNNDGHLDLAIAEGANDQIEVYLGQGNGGFQGPFTYGNASSITDPLFLHIGDFNNDGVVDLILNSVTNTVHVLLGQS